MHVSSSSYDVEACTGHRQSARVLPPRLSITCTYPPPHMTWKRERERRVCISRKSAASSSSDGWQPRTSARTCKSARQRSSIDIQFLRSANKSLSHVHVHLLLLLLLSALSWPGASDPAPYSCHPYPLYRLPILHLENVFDECNAVRDSGG